MIHYILGSSGVGKTFFALNKFKELDEAIYFGILDDDRDSKNLEGCKIINLDEKISDKCFINIIQACRQNPEDKLDYKNILGEKLKEVLQSNIGTIFLDEFQFFCTEYVKNEILASSKDFYLIHQWPEQIKKEYFVELWGKVGKKYLFDQDKPGVI